MAEPKFYNIEPAKGQALLKFQGRLMPKQIELFETEKIEEVRQDKKGQKALGLAKSKVKGDFTDLLIQGDCLSACAYLKSKNIKVDLVYIDPPFASGADYAKKIYLRNGGENEIENFDNTIGEEIMYGDIWQKEDYLNWLYERLLAIRDVMDEKGCIYVHLDWHIGSYVKILLDEVFGEMNFRNEIIWTYGGKGLVNATKSYVPYNANIYFYSKSDEYYLNNKSEEASESVKNRFGKNADKDGNIYFGALLKNNEKSEYEKSRKRFIKENGREPKDNDLAGNINGGSLLKNIWDDIPIIRENAVYDEYRNYSTQKPEALLQRIINASSKKEMVVADFFSGSGTTAKAAYDLGRNFIVSDVGMHAIQTTRDCLTKAGAELDVLKVRDGIKLFRNPTQTSQRIFGLLDGFKDRAELELTDFWDGGIAEKGGSFVPVKFIGLDKKLTKQLLDMVMEEIYQLEDSENSVSDVKIIFAHKEEDINQAYVNKQIKESGKTSIKVELLSLDDLLAEKKNLLYTEDSADVKVSKEKGKTKVEIKKFFSSYLKDKVDEYNTKKVKKGDLLEKAGHKIKISPEGLELIEAVQFDTTLKKDGIWVSNLDLEDKAGVKDKIKGVYHLDTDKFKMKIRNIAGDEIVLNFK